MLPLLIAMGAPLFAIIGYALLQPNPPAAETADKGDGHPAEHIAIPLF
jgi:hypothetical protein